MIDLLNNNKLICRDNLVTVQDILDKKFVVTQTVKKGMF